MSPVAATYWNIPGYVFFWLLFAIAIGLFSSRILFLFRLLYLGKKENNFNNIRKRIKLVLTDFLLQRTNLSSVNRNDLAGIGHTFIVFGFGIFIIGYFIFIGLGEGFGLYASFAYSPLQYTYLTIMDIAGLLIAGGVIWTAVKRYLIRPERLEASTRAGGKLLAGLLTGMFALVLLHYFVEGFRIASLNLMYGQPPISAILAGFLINTGMPGEALLKAYQALWWVNYIIILGFMVYAPYSKHLHPVTSLFNIAFKSLEPKGAMKPIILDEARRFGASTIQDFTWKQLLDLYTCTECGRCHEICPARLSGKILDPREVILKLREHLFKVGPGLMKAAGKTRGSSIPAEAIIGGAVPEEMVWECVNCGNCQEVCPVHIQQMVKLNEMRRALVLQRGTMPKSAQELLNSIEFNGHPWRASNLTRTGWTEGLDIKVINEGSKADILFWVGCTSAFDERSTRVARAIAGILKETGVDFGILGGTESCCGDPARRIGGEYIFQLQAERNIDILRSCGVKRIITGCPHCYNIIKNEYSQFGADFEVIHHTEFIAGLVRKGELRITKSDEATVTYHDACYLGRFNSVFEQPRYILKNLPDVSLVEMQRNGKRSFCCGAGGGHLWVEEQNNGQLINVMRTEQALSTGAQIVVTACPYCLLMLEDGIQEKSAGETLRVMDIAELVTRSQHSYFSRK